MKYFKIKVGYNENDEISIDETELETALHVFLTNSKGVFKNGAVNGSNIMLITEDWHKAMGWNKGHKLGPEDYAQINRELPDYVGYIHRTKEKVEHLIRTKQQNLIGKNADVKMLD